MSISFNKNFSLAFVFSTDLSKVLLENVSGKLDGIIVENSKDGIAEPELSVKINQVTGLEINPSELRIVTSLPDMNKEWKIDVYMTITNFDKITSKDITKMETSSLEDNCHPSLKWLIPLCLDISVYGSTFNQILMK